MNSLKILHIEENHPSLLRGLEILGYENTLAYNKTLNELLPQLYQFHGLIIRSKFIIDKNFIDAASELKFIARVGTGLENINKEYAISKNIQLITASEGNRNAVGEHTLGMLLGIMNKLRLGHDSIVQGSWLREKHRGWELEGKTVGIIGYGNTGKSFAKKLIGFNNLNVLCYDIKPNVGDEAAKQVSLKELKKKAQVLSLHVPITSKTLGLINKKFIDQIENSFWFINTSRGKVVVTEDLIQGLKSGKIIGAGLDVLEYESSSFYSIFNSSKEPKALTYLLKADNVLLSPHVGGWTFESHQKLAQVILEKIKFLDLLSK